MSVQPNLYKQCHIQQFFGSVGFSTSILRRKTIVQLGSLRRCCKPSPVGSRGKTLECFWLFCILNSSKHHSLGSATRNFDESLPQKSTLLSVQGFEFGIPNWYTSFKIALDRALIRRPLMGPLKSGCLGQVVILQNTFIKLKLSKYGHSWQGFSFFPTVIFAWIKICNSRFGAIPED